METDQGKEKKPPAPKKEKAPKITKEQAKAVVEKTKEIVQKPGEIKTPKEALKIAQDAIEAVKAQTRELPPHLSFLENAPVPTHEALAPIILELFHPDNRRAIENDPDWLIRRAENFRKTAIVTGVSWQETTQLIEALYQKALQVANKYHWSGEKLVRLQKEVASLKEAPKPETKKERRPGEGLFEQVIFDEEGGLTPKISQNLPEESVRALMTLNELTRRRPQAVAERDFARIYQNVHDGIGKMAKEEHESDQQWSERRAKAWEALEPFFEKTANEIRKVSEPAPGRKMRFYDKVARIPGLDEDFRNPEKYDLRDREFYAILSEIIESHETPARELYSLYEQSEMSTFMELVRSIPGIGRELARHYRLLQRAIIQCHDIDYYAADPSGDPKNYTTSAALFRNEYWVEAHKDPLTEVAMRCYYQALMMIRDNNNGFIPAQLVEGGQLDELADELFIQRIRMGQVYDVARKEDGTVITNLYHKPVLKDKAMALGEIWDEQKKGINHRGRAVLQMGKGLTIIQLHFLEIIAYSRVPGLDAPTATIFGSKPYEGLTRQINWLGDLAGKYKYGEHLHLPFFSILANRPKSHWTQGEVRKVAEAAAEGRLEEVFGEGAQRLLDITNLAGICGWGGPGSKWRIFDATHYWDERQKETLGAGIWLTFAGDWAEAKVRDLVVDQKYRQEFRQALARTAEFPDADKKWTAEQERVFEVRWLEEGMKKEAYGGKITKEWKELKRKNKATIIEDGERKTIDIKEEMKKWEKIYKTMGVVRMVMRNPIRAASIVELKKTTVPGAPEIRITLRDKIIQETLGTRPHELSGSYIGKPGTPTREMLANQAKVAELEGAIAALHEGVIKYALNEDGEVVMKPRDLTEEDFDKIGDENGDGFRVKDLRGKALKYWQMVKDEVLGSWTAEQWEEAILVDTSPEGRFKKDRRLGRVEYRYNFREGAGKNIGEVLALAAKPKEKGGALVKVKDPQTRTETENPPQLLKLLERKWPYLFAPEDISWSLLDIECLGGRHPLRRAGDFAAVISGYEGLNKFVKNLTGKPDFAELLKSLKESKEAFLGYDPHAGYVACYRFADAMLKLYDRPLWAYIPGIGDYLKTVIPSSIAKEVYGIAQAIDIGANDKKQIIDQMGQLNILPPKEYVFGEHFDYNIEKLAKENSAQTHHMILEMVSRGMVIAAVMMAISALTKKEDEE